MPGLPPLLPHWQFSERHERFIAAPADVVMAAVRRYDPADDRLIGFATALREAPGRLLCRLGFASGLQPDRRFGLSHFLLLADDPDGYRAYGLAGAFWQSDYGLASLADAEAFRAYEAAGEARLVLDFTAVPEAGGTRLVTSTRVHCHDAAALRRFRPYWLLIRPVSGLIRRRILGAIARDATSGALPRGKTV